MGGLPPDHLIIEFRLGDGLGAAVGRVRGGGKLKLRMSNRYIMAKTRYEELIQNRLGKWLDNWECLFFRAQKTGGVPHRVPGRCSGFFGPKSRF